MINLKKKIKIRKLINYNWLILFSSNWCFPCNLLKKNIIKIEQKLNFFFLNINIDFHNNLSLKFNVKNIPTIILNKNKKKIFTGFKTIKKILLILKKN